MHSLQESHLEIVCANCKKRHDGDFSSIFDEHNHHAHYLTKVCDNCGYEVLIRAGDSSGIEHTRIFSKKDGVKD